MRCGTSRRAHGALEGVLTECKAYLTPLQAVLEQFSIPHSKVSHSFLVTIRLRTST